MPFDMPGYDEVAFHWIDGPQIIYEVRPLIENPYCAQCGVLGNRYARSPMIVRDLPQGKPIMLKIDRQRWRCRKCEIVWLDHTPGLADGPRVTMRLFEYILKQRDQGRTHMSIAIEVGVAESTVRNIISGQVK
jgi:transposase-like protein